MQVFKLCGKREEILRMDGHILIEGGPGCGKTTIALLKAKAIIDQGLLKPNQRILFLSFARATISRVEEQAKGMVSNEDKKLIDINTYHGFSWNIIKSYGYLLTLNRSFKLITPPNLAAVLAEVNESNRSQFKADLLREHGTVCFDLFSETASAILAKAQRVCSIMSMAYPYIIVDEFQDTDSNEWKLIQLLGKQSKIIALADLNQRIYDFRGASITRIPEFKEHFSATKFDLGIENNRSGNTDIVEFGDDLLNGKNIGKQYNDVQIIRYGFYKETRSPLKFALIKSINELIAQKPNERWSVAVLVKSRQDTLSISTYLSSQKLRHEVLIDPAGPSLSATILASLMEPSNDLVKDEGQFINHLIQHVRGRKGDKVSKADLGEANFLEKYSPLQKITGAKKKLLIAEIKELLTKRSKLTWKGIPGEDWLAVRSLFEAAKHPLLLNVFEDAKYLRLLNKGAVLNERLSEMWRQHGCYLKARQAVDDALTQEHFSLTNRTFSGVIIMNVHKSKGKEFDHVLIWEDPYKPIVYSNASVIRLQEDRRVLRVAVTRAKQKAKFLTPARTPCVLL